MYTPYHTIFACNDVVSHSLCVVNLTSSCDSNVLGARIVPVCMKCSVPYLLIDPLCVVHPVPGDAINFSTVPLRNRNTAADPD